MVNGGGGLASRRFRDAEILADLPGCQRVDLLVPWDCRLLTVLGVLEKRVFAFVRE